MDRITVNGITINLSTPVSVEMEWIGQERLMEELLAAWMTVHESDIPLCPRVLGPPGVGKTTLAYAAARKVNKDVYIFQCTADTRPEDLIITPVMGDNQEILYRASSLVTAMIHGAVCILDEGNRMPEKAWASLAPLLDTRRYVDSIIAGVRVEAHKDFRFCVTMNQDASVFEIPDYISSRLQPKIHVPFPTADDEFAILEYNLPFTQKEILVYIVNFLQKAHKEGEAYSIRDGINIARYMLKLARHKPQPFSSETIESLFKKILPMVIDQDALDYMEGKRRKKEAFFGSNFEIIPRSILDILSNDRDQDVEDDNELDEDEDDGDDFNDNGDAEVPGGGTRLPPS